MGEIRIGNRFSSDTTVLSNCFIDNFMPKANGEYVKIYLYFLRLSSGFSDGKPLLFSLSDIIDRLESTSKDVERALTYWEKKNLIRCEYDETGELSAIEFLDPVSGTMQNAIDSPPRPTNAAASDAVPIDATPDEAVSGKAVPGDAGAKPDKDKNKEKPDVTALPAGRLSALKTDKDAKQILFIAEQYLQHTLSAREIEMLLYFYDQRHFSVDLLDYLLDYCVSNGHKNWRYIQKVGLNWDREGIDTAEKARKSSITHNQRRYVIMRAYGLGSRDPAPTEAEMIDRWTNEYPLSFELVLEAVDRTMNQLHEPNFHYTDGILQNWIKADIRSFDDIAAQDAAHEKRKLDQKASEKKTDKTARSASNSGTAFNNFESRDYDNADLARKLARLK